MVQRLFLRDKKFLKRLQGNETPSLSKEIDGSVRPTSEINRNGQTIYLARAKFISMFFDRSVAFLPTKNITEWLLFGQISQSD